MEGAAQAAAYARADFSEPNELFLAHLAARWPARAGRVVDLGCGPADILLRVARRWPGVRCTGIDGSDAMLAEARRAVAAAGLGERIRLCRHRLGRGHPDLPPADVVLSNSLLHHLADPGVLWRGLRRWGAPGALVQVMDLLRPPDPQAVERLVGAYAADAPAVLREDFRRSLHAAYTLAEVAAQLRDAGLGHFRLEQVSDRHWLAAGRLPEAGAA